MKKIVCTIIVILLTIISTQSIATPKQKPADPNQVVKETINQFMKKYRVPGVAVALYVHNRPYTYYYGYANKESKKAIDSKTIFELGSITKLFTTLLLAQQIDAKKMQLNASITRYFPELNQNTKQIAQVNLLNLATHTAGFSLDLPEGITTQQALINYLANWHTDLTINKQWSYSNIGIGLLAYAIANTTKQSYEDLLRQKILQVLGMQHTYLTVTDSTNFAQGYNDDGKSAPHAQLGLLPAAWALKSTLPDMQRFLSAAIHLSGTPYSVSHALRVAQTPYFTLEDNVQQGLAWQIYIINKKNVENLLNPPTNFNLQPQSAKLLAQKQFNGDALIDKTGTTDGFRAYIAVIPNKGSGIVILANRYVANRPLVKAGRDILFKVNGNIY